MRSPSHQVLLDPFPSLGTMPGERGVRLHGYDPLREVRGQGMVCTSTLRHVSLPTALEILLHGEFAYSARNAVHVLL